MSGVYFRRNITLEFSKLIIIRYESRSRGGGNVCTCGFVCGTLWDSGFRIVASILLVNLMMIRLSCPTERLTDFMR